MSILNKIKELAGAGMHALPQAQPLLHGIANQLQRPQAPQGGSPQGDQAAIQHINQAAGFHPQMPPSQPMSNQDAFTIANVNSSIGGMQTPGGVDMGWAPPYAPIQSPYGPGVNPDQHSLDSINHATGFQLPIYLKKR